MLLTTVPSTTQVEYALRVLDATGTDRAVVGALSTAARWVLELAADHPDRVTGIITIAGVVPLRDAHAGNERRGRVSGRATRPAALQRPRSWPGPGRRTGPAALAQPGGVALGAQAGLAVIRQLAADAGYTRFRQVTANPVNVVLELRS